MLNDFYTQDTLALLFKLTTGRTEAYHIGNQPLIYIDYLKENNIAHLQSSITAHRLLAESALVHLQPFKIVHLLHRRYRIT